MLYSGSRHAVFRRQNRVLFFFYVSLTVHLSITLDNDQLNEQIL
jgi:hypothetical protein